MELRSSQHVATQRPEFLADFSISYRILVVNTVSSNDDLPVNKLSQLLQNSCSVDNTLYIPFYPVTVKVVGENTGKDYFGTDFQLGPRPRVVKILLYCSSAITCTNMSIVNCNMTMHCGLS